METEMLCSVLHGRVEVYGKGCSTLSLGVRFLR